ncbi:hypothetical protein [Azospirillum cavernae]|nr:hypothetical protein [Azospirillum cavernae]
MDTLLAILFACVLLFAAVVVLVARRAKNRKGALPKDIYPHW